MTVIYSVALPAFCVQVGDRRLTRIGQAASAAAAQATAESEVEDEQANKALIYGAPDGLVSISYTGLAFILQVPTDEWLVSTITGATDLVVDGRTPMRVGRLPSHPDVGQAIERIREALNNVMRVLRPSRRRISLEIDVVGWQWQRRSGRDVRRLLWNLKPRPTGEIEISREIPRRLPRRCVYLSSIGDDHLSDIEFRALAATAEADASDLDSTENTLLSALRTVAERSSSVGPNATAVALPHPARGWARVRFRPVSPVEGAILPSGGRLEVGFAPWIVGGGLIAPPSVVVGTLEFDLGPVKVRVEGPRGKHGLLAAGSSQPRQRE